MVGKGSGGAEDRQAPGDVPPSDRNRPGDLGLVAQRVGQALSEKSF